ncbi:MAG: DUF4340 domain-containing protein [Pseudomonadota bacterium]
MKPLTKVLFAGLGVQALLCVATWWPRGSGAVPAHALVTLDAAAIDRIEIARSGENAEPVALVKEGERWLIASSAGYPAQADKVQELIDSLTALEVRRPLATKAVNHDALKVGEKEFGKKVTLSAGDQQASVVIGAASSHAVHVRLADEDDVYEARGMSEWTIKDRASSYWKPEVVDLDVDTATGIVIALRDGTTVGLSHSENGWIYEGDAPEGELIDPDKVSRLAEAACKIRLREPVGTTAEPAFGLDNPAATVTVTTEAEDATSTFSYELGNTADGEVYLETGASPWIVTVSEYSAKSILEAGPASLVLDDDAPTGMGGMGGMGGLPPGIDLSQFGM